MRGEQWPKGERSLADTKLNLEPRVQAILPDANTSYYEQTNALHCEEGEGGSKFEDERVQNIFDVIAMAENLGDQVESRTDDRDALLAAGAPEAAFLPAKKDADAPEGLPEALYFKVEGVGGRLGIIQLSELSTTDQILVRREKGHNKKDEKGYVPPSFTLVRGTTAEMPKTDFATIIVGRVGGEDGSNEVWTVHPGAPIRIETEDFNWTENLPGPDEEADGKQSVKVVTVAKLIESGMNPDDYIKLVPGDINEVVEEYEVVE